MRQENRRLPNTDFLPSLYTVAESQSEFASSTMEEGTRYPILVFRYRA
jgi:hypothetical protein